MSDVSHETGCCTLSIPPHVAGQIAAKARGERKNVYHGGTLCSGCFQEEPMPGQRYGRICHALAMKETRRKQREKRLRREARRLKLSKGENHGARKAE